MGEHGRSEAGGSRPSSRLKAVARAGCAGIVRTAWYVDCDIDERRVHTHAA